MIIKSLLDSDLYKFTMMQAVLHQFPDVQVKYEFRCRNEMKPWTSEMMKELADEIENLCSLRFTEDELSYLGSLSFMKPNFINFLRIFQLDKRYIQIDRRENLSLNIKGPWLHTILFEVPLLAIVNEIYFKYYVTNYIMCGKNRLRDKINKIKEINIGFKLADFGTRRRFSRLWHEEVIATLVKELPNHFIGTSNVWLAKKYNTKPIGTMAHEWLQAGQALTRVKDSQRYMFQKWADEYRGQLGIALSDVVGVDAFIKDFDMYFCKLFDGCRHDSGDPYLWTQKILKMYQNFNIDPKTKIAVFSDGLTVDSAIDIFNTIGGRIKTTFGIGTNLTNDVGVTPLNIVIKMTECQGMPVAKISDSLGKGMCNDDSYLTYLKKQFQI